jgi:DNA repair protein RecN (Recombination protein N)
LAELRVENLGVIAELGLLLGHGMTAVTGETGAGKTLVVEALELLVGARADASLVRRGSPEARVEGRFELDEAARAAVAQGDPFGGLDDASDIGDEVVLTRVVPAEGRSRAYLNGRLVPASVLSEVGRHLVELHGQSSHHALLTPGAQRGALDRFAGPDAAEALAAHRRAWRRVRNLEAERAGVGGDQRARAHEVDLLQFHLAEIDAAGVDEVDEVERLREEEGVLADARGLREAAEQAHELLSGAALDALGAAVAALADRPRFEDPSSRLVGLQDEVADVARLLRQAGDGITEDPERLDAVAGRMRTLVELRRKYGDTLADVLAFRDDAAARLEALLDAEARAGSLDAEIAGARGDLRDTTVTLSAVRRDASTELGERITAVLHDLGMPGARFRIVVESSPVGEEGGDVVTFLLAANAGEGEQPLARVASGGELARTMLAARVVLTGAPPTLVFDEVDAGVGGEAGVAVGRKLAVVAEGHQVLCVTHLAQVASFADHHVVVSKQGTGSGASARTVATAVAAAGTERVVELSRMLAGSDSGVALDHAEELLASAARERTG